ncbi:Alpha/Beta hydrolase protein [Fusarium oxysporum]|nr:Alpha/Beta hydrolase protein [Fusarium oxysporum]
MEIDKLTPNDPRVERREVEVRNKTYSYLIGKPEGMPKGTIYLIHGFPDISLGWRYQVPVFISLGYQVLMPDSLGYGNTSSPEALDEFSLKSLSDDVAAICTAIIPGEQIVLGGHDWGGALAWRVAMWHPTLIKAVFSVCVPYIPPTAELVDLADLVAAGEPTNFKYQLQFRGPDVEERIKSPNDIRQLIQGIFGGRGEENEAIFTTERGVLFENLGRIGPSPLLDEAETDYYTVAFTQSGLRGPLNWYRTHQINFEHEKVFTEKGRHKFAMPALFILARDEPARPPGAESDVYQHFEDLTYGEVSSGHWALWQAASEVNSQIKKWIETKVEEETATSPLKLH